VRGAGHRQVEQGGDHVDGGAGLVPDHGGAFVVAAAGAQRVVLAVDEDGLDVPGADPQGLPPMPGCAWPGGFGRLVTTGCAPARSTP
jgi:hypothetical protein